MSQKCWHWPAVGRPLAAAEATSPMSPQHAGLLAPLVYHRHRGDRGAGTHARHVELRWHSVFGWAAWNFVNIYSKFSLPEGWPVLTPKQCQFGISAPRSKILTKHSTWQAVKGSLVLLCCSWSSSSLAAVWNWDNKIKWEGGGWTRPKTMKCVKADFILSLQCLIFVRTRTRI